MNDFIKKNKEFFISSSIIFVLLSILFICFSIFPFGNNTIANYDMLSQILPQLQLVFDFFQGKNSLFFTTSFGLGANTFGYLLYYLLSPFNLLLLIGGDGNTIYIYNIIFILKLIAICCVFIWFLKKYFKNLNSLSIILLSISYAFCGYMFFNYTFFSFLDYLIYAPIITHCFILLKDNNKVFPLGLCVFFMILSCFALGCFSLIYLLIIFGLYIFLVCRKEDRKRIILKTVTSILIGIGLSLWLLIPCLIQYLSSSRNIDTTIFQIQTFYGTPTKIQSTIVEFTPLIFSLLYFIKCDKKNKLNIFLISCQSISLLTILSDELVSNLNGGATLGFYARYGYISTFILFVTASLYILKKKEVYENLKKDKFAIFCVCLTITILLLLFVFLNVAGYQKLSSFFSSQYSNILTTFMWIVIFIPIFLMFFMSFKFRISNKQFLICNLILLLVCIPSNFGLFISGGLKPCSFFEDAKQLTNSIDDNIRVKIDAGNVSYLTNSLYNCSSVCVFSSLVENNTIKTLDQLGLYTSTNYSFSNTGTILSDIILGNQYQLLNYKSNDWFLELISQTNNLYLYRNILVNNGINIINSPILYNSNNDNLLVQQQIFNALGGVGNILSKTDVQLSYKNCTKINDTIFLNDTSYGEISVNKTLNENEIIYLYVTQDSSLDIKVNGSMVKSGCFYQLKTNEISKILITENINLNSLEFYIMDTNLLKELPIHSSNLTFDYNLISCKINLVEPSTIVIPYTNLEGFSIFVNDKKVQCTNKFLNLITLDLNSGENNIKIEFSNPLYKYVLLGVVLGLFCIFLGLIINKFFNKFNDKLINISFLVVLMMLIVYYIIYPTTLTILKLLTII